MTLQQAAYEHPNAAFFMAPPPLLWRVFSCPWSLYKEWFLWCFYARP